MNPPFFLQWTSAVCYTIMNDANGMYPSWLDWCFVTTQLVLYLHLSSYQAHVQLTSSNLYICCRIHHIYILLKRHYLASFMNDSCTGKIVTEYVTDIVEENLYILLEIHRQHIYQQHLKTRYWCWVFFSSMLLVYTVCTQSRIYDGWLLFCYILHCCQTSMPFW